MKFVSLSLIVLALLTGCSSNYGRYSQKSDSIPSRLPSQHQLKDAVPREEPKSRGGNKHYNVRGVDYKVLDDAQGFKQSGKASWYGEKFHGHLTSNGEIYDMYAMSAAHKTLPLPSYVKVTNIANNKSVVVRVNDRGPFHRGRIIDLSYSAAYKIGMLKAGTADVEIEVLTPWLTPKPQKNIASTNTTKPYYIQVFATSSMNKAKTTVAKLSQSINHEISYPYRDGVFRIFVGPLNKNTDKNSLLSQIKSMGYTSAYVKQSLN